MISFAPQIKELLHHIVARADVHGRWLNTLSYLENCGARKIARCEHPQLVKEEMLKHAAEEFRHAHYLKRQIEKLLPQGLPSYRSEHLLGASATLSYLKALDLMCCRYLTHLGLNRTQIKETAYLLVTFAIEKRAEELYPIYDKTLRAACSAIKVKSILLEEKEHLQEMEKGLSMLPDGFVYAEKICLIESRLCASWLKAVSLSLS